MLWPLWWGDLGEQVGQDPAGSGANWTGRTREHFPALRRWPGWAARSLPLPWHSWNGSRRLRSQRKGPVRFLPAQPRAAGGAAPRQRLSLGPWHPLLPHIAFLPALSHRFLPCCGSPEGCMSQSLRGRKLK